MSSKQNIETTIDLKGIFHDDNPSQFAEIDDMVKAYIDKNQIIYNYSPVNCYVLDEYYNCDNIKSWCEDSQKTICESDKKDDYLKIDSEYCNSDYCENLKQECEQEKKSGPLCKIYNPSSQNDFDELNKRVVIRSNIDGSDFKELQTIEPEGRIISFDFANKDNVFYFIDGDVYKINKLNSKKELVMKDRSIAKSPFSDNSTIGLIGGENTFDIELYDIESMKKKDTLGFYSNSSTSLSIRLDKYDSESYYSLSNSKYDTELKDGQYGLYKNGKRIFTFNEKSASNLFTTKDYIYVLVYKEEIDKNTFDYSYKKVLYKINKKDYSLVDTFITENLEWNNLMHYIFTDDSNKVYFNTKEGGLYYFDETTEDFVLDMKINYMGTDTKHFHNFIIYTDTRETILYNTISKEKTSLGIIEYYYINEQENRIYFVINEENIYKLYYYEVD